MLLWLFDSTPQWVLGLSVMRVGAPTALSMQGWAGWVWSVVGIPPLAGVYGLAMGPQRGLGGQPSGFSSSGVKSRGGLGKKLALNVSLERKMDP